MKQRILAMALAALLASCGNGEQKTAEKKDTPATLEKKAEEPMSAEAQRGLDLIAQNDCLGCHKVEERLQGPAYREVAEKYAGQSGAVMDTLAQRIIKGHVGVWGDVPMTPHPTLSQADAKAMVAYVMSLKQ